MKKYFLKGILLALFAGLFFSCSDSDNIDVPPTNNVELGNAGAFILSEGGFNESNAKLGYYNPETKKFHNDIFNIQNKMNLGAGAQDIHVHNSRIFITVTQSNKIFVTNLRGELLENGNISSTISDYKSPRHIASQGKYVYVNFYSGHLIKMDATTLEIVDKLEIEKFSERMTIVDNKLYIANSYRDGVTKGNTISVVNLDSFKLEKPIEIALNPTIVESDGKGNIFVVSLAAYDANFNPLSESAFTKIDSKTHETTILKNNIVNHIALQNDRVLITNKVGYDPAITEFMQYNIATNKLSDEQFLKIETMPKEEQKQINDLYYISIDPTNKDMYVTINDFVTTGTVYIFSEKGEYKTHFRSEAVGTQKAVFVTHKK